MIYELFKDKTPTTTTANLLSTAIFSNTLNFKSKITTERDIKAYNDLKQYTDLPDNWVDQYYNEVEAIAFNDIFSAIKNDTKILPNNIVIGQMELWEADKMLNTSDFLEILNYAMKDYESWFMNMPSIKCGKTYFVAESQNIKNTLNKYLNVVWDGDVGVVGGLYLRKEIIKSCGWDK